MNILEQIIDYKQQEVALAKQQKSITDLEEMPCFSRQALSLKQALKEGSGVISEFKRQSPSKGVINSLSSVEQVALAYEKAGASAISILTDQNYFGGSTGDILAVRPSLNIPILRKEFIVDAYQIYEAKAIGADAILLIASVLDPRQVLEFSVVAKALGLEVLLEIHKEEELSAINPYVDCVGVNNRNLKDFTVDIQNSISLSSRIPEKFAKVSESGIRTQIDIKRLKTFGFKGFLIGENFMKTQDPGQACKQFIHELNNIAL